MIMVLFVRLNCVATGNICCSFFQAKSKRRMYMGLHEVLKHVKRGRIKCVIMARNIEQTTEEGSKWKLDLFAIVNNYILQIHTMRNSIMVAHHPYAFCLLSPQPCSSRPRPNYPLDFQLLPHNFHPNHFLHDTPRPWPRHSRYTRYFLFLYWNRRCIWCRGTLPTHARPRLSGAR